MRKYLVYQVDSFTKEVMKGNPAGVVYHADGLSEQQMQMIARELNNSETAFLLAPDGNDCDGVIRYFTPQVEVPTCGHATIAAMYAKAVEEGLDSSIFRMRTRIGVLPFEIIKTHHDYKVIMTQGRIEFGTLFEGDMKEKILKALGLSEDDLNARCPVQIVSTGHSKVMIGIQSREKLNYLTPQLTALSELSRIIHCNGYFVFTFDSDSKDILTYGRMFAPAVGINEDPVTGNANGPLGAYLVHHGLVDTSLDAFCFKAKQGEAINRPGIIEVKVKIEDRKPVLVQIAGEAVIVFKTEIAIV
ncbi:MAG TPA: PhzF family isomerase [Firmicutes bacterium]|jgi:PhzF family phenazine biosynthesis protein|nr:PhzF family isomerase [Bacillota bacterium]